MEKTPSFIDMFLSSADHISWREIHQHLKGCPIPRERHTYEEAFTEY